MEFNWTFIFASLLFQTLWLTADCWWCRRLISRISLDHTGHLVNSDWPIRPRQHFQIDSHCRSGSLLFISRVLIELKKWFHSIGNESFDWVFQLWIVCLPACRWAAAAAAALAPAAAAALQAWTLTQVRFIIFHRLYFTPPLNPPSPCLKTNHSRSIILQLTAALWRHNSSDLLHVVAWMLYSI